MFHAGNGYWLPDVSILTRRLKTNTVSNTAFRGFGGPQGMIAIERVMGAIARERGLDPLDVRKANLLREGFDRTPYDQTVEDYETQRNKPEVDGSSCMSPYLHFGHIGPLTIALEVEAAVKKNPKLRAARDSYFNELITWRELAVNFVRYTPNYDSHECAENWAKQTIAEHAKDEREFLYQLSELENAKTHDDLWNAAQTQMVRHGWMHNVMRMYWAKKILEWTPDVKTAVQYAVHLNDKYFLDGRDPNGYAGIAWAILGKFDRAWGERPIFGKIRYMSGGSTGKKFDSKKYMQQMHVLPEQGGLF